jgi:hypothetical protein
MCQNYVSLSILTEANIVNEESFETKTHLNFDESTST